MVSLPRSVLLFVWACSCSFAEDIGKEINATVAERTNKTLQLIFEARSRMEYRPGQSFGAEPDLLADFVRFKIGLSYRPVSWVRFVGVAMDARAPFYGPSAPSSTRDPLDLHEGYAEFRPEQKLGFGAIVGRTAANYGDTRLIGSPQWAYIPRMYDGARVFWRSGRHRLEGLFLSPVKIGNAGWNKPVLGDHIVGTYNTFTAGQPLSLDYYVLRHEQNRPGGFTGVGRFVTNTFGSRFFGPIPNGFRYSVEIIGQTGHIGPLPHRANAWAAQIGRRFEAASKPFDLAAEYKYASGGGDPNRSGTFDQISPAAHDKLGHADVLGWRNTKNIRVMANWSLTRGLTLNAMYNNTWLADARDAAYNAQGRPIVRSASGTAGTHVGQEADIYGSYKWQGLTFGAGYGYLFTGEFIRRTTPDVAPQYFYVFQTYTF